MSDSRSTPMEGGILSTILVVDDKTADRKLLVSLLTQLQHKVLEAADAAQALKELREHHPALAIIEIVMPGISGLQLVESIHADPSIANTPILFYTAWYDEEQTARAIRSFGYAVLAKPVSRQEVVRQVERMLKDAGEAKPPVDS